LNVYDITGKFIASLLNARQSAGSYEVEFNATNLSSGVYFYTLKADEFEKTLRMVVVR
jgi:hypothetical protein